MALPKAGDESCLDLFSLLISCFRAGSKNRISSSVVHAFFDIIYFCSYRFHLFIYTRFILGLFESLQIIMNLSETRIFTGPVHFNIGFHCIKVK